jgi:hypothetical protein
MGLRTGRSLGEAAGSAACFFVVLAALMAADVQVRERIVGALAGARPSGWSDQASAVIRVVADAASQQSIAHAPLLVFTVVGALLLIFMLRT